MPRSHGSKRDNPKNDAGRLLEYVNKLRRIRVGDAVKRFGWSNYEALQKLRVMAKEGFIVEVGTEKFVAGGKVKLEFDDVVFRAVTEEDIGFSIMVDKKNRVLETKGDLKCGK